MVDPTRFGTCNGRQSPRLGRRTVGNAGLVLGNGKNLMLDTRRWSAWGGERTIRAGLLRKLSDCSKLPRIMKQAGERKRSWKMGPLVTPSLTEHANKQIGQARNTKAYLPIFFALLVRLWRVR